MRLETPAECRGEAIRFINGPWLCKLIPLWGKQPPYIYWGAVRDNGWKLPPYYVSNGRRW